MKIWVGVTDKNWFEYLMRLGPDEVNFWQPSGTRNFRVLQPGEPFLFKLHSPYNFIVGGGYFVRYSALPASLAWDCHRPAYWSHFVIGIKEPADDRHIGASAGSA
jgi:putative restriction endonuclease